MIWRMKIWENEEEGNYSKSAKNVNMIKVQKNNVCDVNAINNVNKWTRTIYKNEIEDIQ